MPWRHSFLPRETILRSSVLSCHWQVPESYANTSPSAKYNCLRKKGFLIRDFRNPVQSGSRVSEKNSWREAKGESRDCTSSWASAPSSIGSVCGGGRGVGGCWSTAGHWVKGREVAWSEGLSCPLGSTAPKCPHSSRSPRGSPIAPPPQPYSPGRRGASSGRRPSSGTADSPSCWVWPGKDTILLHVTIEMIEREDWGQVPNTLTSIPS